MKLALISDIHANRHALQACLEHARAQGAQRLALLGDLLGYGGEPRAVMDMVLQLVQEGAVVVRGNHDALALNPPSHIRHQGDQGAQWMHEQLAPEHLAFLQQLPMRHQEGQVLLVHASADQPERWRYVDNSAAAQRCLAAASAHDANTRYVFCGHVHEQALYYLGRSARPMAFAPTPGVAIAVPAHRQWLAVVGACGQPRDGDTRANYVLFDTLACHLTFHRVAYDHLGAAAAVRAAPLPESFAQRLLEGR